MLSLWFADRYCGPQPVSRAAYSCNRLVASGSSTSSWVATISRIISSVPPPIRVSRGRQIGSGPTTESATSAAGGYAEPDQQTAAQRPEPGIVLVPRMGQRYGDLVGDASVLEDEGAVGEQ